MAACRTQSVTDACKFRPELARLKLEDQLAMVANCVEVAASVLWECAAKVDRLADYIDTEPPPQ